jgi:hypothetical protein
MQRPCRHDPAVSRLGDRGCAAGDIQSPMSRALLRRTDAAILASPGATDMGALSLTVPVATGHRTLTHVLPRTSQ